MFFFFITKFKIDNIITKHFTISYLQREVILKEKETVYKCAHEHEFTCKDVIDPVCPWSTATGAQVLKHHTLIILSQLPAAIIVFS